MHSALVLFDVWDLFCVKYRPFNIPDWKDIILVG